MHGMRGARLCERRLFAVLSLHWTATHLVRRRRRHRYTQPQARLSVPCMQGELQITCALLVWHWHGTGRRLSCVCMHCGAPWAVALSCSISEKFLGSGCDVGPRTGTID